MTLYCLFSSPAAEPEDETVPISLVMDDEMQYRCAGFIQAEIERYAEDLEGESPSKEQEKDDDTDSGLESENYDTEKSKQKKGDKSKRKQQALPDGMFIVFLSLLLVIFGSLIEAEQEKT